MSEELEMEGIVIPEDMRGIFTDLTTTQNELRKAQSQAQQLQKQQNELTMEMLRLEGQARYLQGKIAAFQQQAEKVGVEMDDADRKTIQKLVE